MCRWSVNMLHVLCFFAMYHRRPWGKSALLVSPYPSSKSISTCHVEMCGNSCTRTSSPSFLDPSVFFLNKFNIFSLSPEGRSANAKTSSHVLGNGNWSRSRRSNRMRGTKNSPSYLRNLGCFKWLCSPLPLGLLWGNTYRCTETSNKNILPNVRL